jgi:hypothetical protein
MGPQLVEVSCIIEDVNYIYPKQYAPQVSL